MYSYSFFPFEELKRRLISLFSGTRNLQKQISSGFSLIKKIDSDFSCERQDPVEEFIRNSFDHSPSVKIINPFTCYIGKAKVENVNIAVENFTDNNIPKLVPKYLLFKCERVDTIANKVFIISKSVFDKN